MTLRMKCLENSLVFNNTQSLYLLVMQLSFTCNKEGYHQHMLCYLFMGLVHLYLITPIVFNKHGEIYRCTVLPLTCTVWYIFNAFPSLNAVPVIFIMGI